MRLSRLFGTPGKGMHSLRIAGLPVIDLLATGLAAGYLSLSGGCFGLHFAKLWGIGIALHEILGVRTRFNAWLFERPWPDPANQNE